MEKLIKVKLLILALLPALVFADAQQDRINEECIKAIGKQCKDQTFKESSAQRLEDDTRMEEIDSLINQLETNRRESARTSRITNQLINIQNQNQLIIRKMYAK